MPGGILGFRDHMFARKVQQKEGRCMREGRSFVPGGILGFRDIMFARKVQQERGRRREGRERDAVDRPSIRSANLSRSQSPR